MKQYLSCVVTPPAAVATGAAIIAGLESRTLGVRRVCRWSGMATALLALGSFAVLGAGEAVPPNQEPAPGLVADSWACYEAGVLPSDILSGDLDDDGWLELAVSCFGTGNVYFYDNLGNRETNMAPGVFENDASLQTPMGSLPGAAALGLGVDGVYVLSNVNIPGTPPRVSEVVMRAPVEAGVDLPCETVSMATADLDHERRIDDVVAVQGEGASRVEDLSDGSASPLSTSLSSSICAAVGDMNQDGWQDVVILSSSGLSIAYNRGGRGPDQFLPAVIVADGNAALGIGNPTDVAIADFDSDGLLDIVVVGNNPQRDLVAGYARVFLNSPAAVGSEFAPLPAGGPMTTWGFDATAVVAADLDGNGRDDFAVVNKGSDTVTVFLSDALSMLQVDDRATTVRCLSDADRKSDRLQIQFRVYKLELQCGHQPVAATVGDFDFNGKLDIAVVHLSATPEARPQDCSCVEVLFDVACGFHRSGKADVPNQSPHSQIDGVTGQESRTCKGCSVDIIRPGGELGFSGRIQAGGQVPFREDGGFALFTEACVGWQEQTDSKDAFWKRLTLGGAMSLVSRKLPFDFEVSQARLYLDIELLNSHSLTGSGDFSLSAVLTLAADYNNNAPFANAGEWEPSADLYSEAELGNLTLTSTTTVSLASGAVTEELGGWMGFALDNVAITPRVAVSASLDPAAITHMLAGVSVERYRTTVEREMAKGEAQDDLSCCSVKPEDDGKLAFGLAFEGSSLSSLGFTLDAAYTQWLCKTRLAVEPYVELHGDTLSLSGSRFVLGVAVAW
jgi:hypothetical protein